MNSWANDVEQLPDRTERARALAASMALCDVVPAHLFVLDGHDTVSS